jgi:hypothetical protein
MPFGQLKRREFITLLGAAQQSHGRLPQRGSIRATLREDATYRLSFWCLF